MNSQDLRAKSVSVLRAMAGKAGITVKKDWKKKDLIKALTAKETKKTAKPAGKPAAKGKAPAKKRAAVKPAAQSAPRRKAGAKKALPKKTAAARGKAPAAKPMEQLTIAELRKLAGELGISLTGKTRKSDIIAAFRRAKTGKDIPPEPVRRKPAAKKEKPGPEKKPGAPPAEKKKTVAVPGGVSPQAAEAAPASEPPTAGYDGDRVMSMPVTPRRLYVYWELSEDTVARYRGSLNLKVLDVKTNAFFYVPISERIGESFINVSPEGEYAIEVGVINYDGEFINLVQLMPAEIPGAGDEGESVPPEEGGGLPEEFFRIPGTASSY